jgi:hypothetical protein
MISIVKSVTSDRPLVSVFYRRLVYDSSYCEHRIDVNAYSVWLLSEETGW